MREVATPIRSPMAEQTPNAFHSIKLLKCSFLRIIIWLYKNKRTDISDQYQRKKFHDLIFLFKNKVGRNGPTLKFVI